jgi:hypothetical protein
MATRTVIGRGSVTLRDECGVECEIETTAGPRLLTLKTAAGDTFDEIEVVLVHKTAVERGVEVEEGGCPDCGSSEAGSCFYCKAD